MDSNSASSVAAYLRLGVLARSRDARDTLGRTSKERRKVGATRGTAKAQTKTNNERPIRAGCEAQTKKKKENTRAKDDGTGKRKKKQRPSPKTPTPHPPHPSAQK